MRIWTLTCAAVIVAVPASAQEETPGIDLLAGHPIYHESEQEAGVAMALSTTSEHRHATDLRGLCEELRIAAGLASENGDELRLEVIFVVPYKGMVVEGYYLPNDGTSEQGALVPSSGVARETLDAIVMRAGIPPGVLDEANVQHEISCETGEPRWHVNWYDVRPVGDEDPDTVIERTYRRFLAVHQRVVEHKTRGASLPETQKTTTGG